MRRTLAALRRLSQAFPIVAMLAACSQSAQPSLLTNTSTSAQGGSASGAVASSTGSSSSSGTGGGTSGGGGSTGGTSTGGTSNSGTSTGGITGTACVTAANCPTDGGPQVCLDGGFCGIPAVALGCTKVGDACAPELACCEGACDAGTCTPWLLCADVGSFCQSDIDCCVGGSCDAGACAPSCGGSTTSCMVDSDCCEAEGLRCFSVSLGAPLQCLTAYSPFSCAPTATGGAIECNLGTSCMLSRSGGDPCGPAGYVCDPFFRVCRDPSVDEPCVPGGPPCQGISGSAASDLQCFSIPLSGSYCEQPCAETADCIVPYDSCLSLSGQESACFTSQCDTFFGSCSGTASGDSTCYPYPFGSITVGICFQGGDARAQCSIEGSRENGGLCVQQEQCTGGLCQAVCNAGTGGSPACDAGTCIALSTTGSASVLGACVQTCDITDLDGGGCISTPFQPEKCFPDFFYGLADDGKGFCILEASNPLGVGDTCTQGVTGDAIDPCGPGLLCGQVGNLTYCTQVCNGAGTQGNCPAGQTCHAGGQQGRISTMTGYCQ
jgi:hypothetical protein